MMLLYWYTNTFLFCLCSHCPRGRVLFLRVLLYTQVLAASFGLFQPPAFRYFAVKATEESLSWQRGVGSMVHPQQQKERSSVSPGG